MGFFEQVQKRMRKREKTKKCSGRESNPYGLLCPRDFKSRVSTSFTTRAGRAMHQKSRPQRIGLERKTGFEPATPTLARSCSTN